MVLALVTRSNAACVVSRHVSRMTASMDSGHRGAAVNAAMSTCEHFAGQVAALVPQVSVSSPALERVKAYVLIQSPGICDVCNCILVLYPDSLRACGLRILCVVRFRVAQRGRNTSLALRHQAMACRASEALTACFQLLDINAENLALVEGIICQIIEPDVQQTASYLLRVVDKDAKKAKSSLHRHNVRSN